MDKTDSVSAIWDNESGLYGENFSILTGSSLPGVGTDIIEILGTGTASAFIFCTDQFHCRFRRYH